MRLPSKFRMVQCTAAAADEGGGDTPALRLSRPSQSSTSAGIACSSSVAAAAHETVGHIALKPLTPSLKASGVAGRTLAAHNGAIADLSFDPFSPHHLASCCRDGSIRLWDTLASTASAVLSLDAAAARSATMLRFHPSARSVLALGASPRSILVDCQAGAVVREFASESTSALVWNDDGSRLIVLSGNGGLRLFDPRAAAHDDAALDLNVRPHNGVIDGRSHALYVFGQDPYRAALVLRYDTRKLDAAVFCDRPTLSAGVSLPVYDRDSRLLCLSTRGASAVNVYDTSSSTTSLSLCTTFASAVSLQGLCAKPKYACDVASCEVAHLVALTTDDISGVSLTVPKKQRGFYADIFPPTASDEAAMTAQDYLDGNDALPKLERIDPDTSELYRRHHQEHAKDTNHIDDDDGDGNATGKRLSVPSTTTTTTTTNEQQQRHHAHEKSANRLQLEQRFQKSPFFNLTGKEPRSLSAIYYGLQPADAVSLAVGIASNARLMLIPWKTMTGSALAVLPLARKGRVAERLPLLRAHPHSLTSLALSDADASVLATGCIDAHVRVWRLPPDGLVDADLSEPRLDLLLDGKVTALCWNPVARDVLVTSSHGVDQVVVQLWDVASASTSASASIVLEGHVEPVNDVRFSSDGRFLASTSPRSRECRVFEPRVSSHAIARFEPAEVLRDTRVLWLADSGCVLVVGFATGSLRQMSMWRVFKAADDADAAPLSGGPVRLATHVIDQGSASLVPHYDEDTRVLFVGSVGDRTIRFFELDSDAGTIEALGTYQCPDLVSGISFGTKQMCDVMDVEICRMLRLSEDTVKPVSFCVPRRRKQFFQDDVFPATRAHAFLYTSAEWFGGVERRTAARQDLCPPSVQRLSDAPPEQATVHERRRIELLNSRAEEQQHPSFEEHIISKLSTDAAATDAPIANRWDAAPIQSNDVDDDEWDD